MSTVRWDEFDSVAEGFSAVWSTSEYISGGSFLARSSASASEEARPDPVIVHAASYRHLPVSCR